jgi:hypothetical protein
MTATSALFLTTQDFPRYYTNRIKGILHSNMIIDEREAAHMVKWMTKAETRQRSRSGCFVHFCHFRIGRDRSGPKLCDDMQPKQ